MEQEISNPHVGSMYYFCFFCGKPLGPAKDHKHIEQLAIQHNFKRRPHYSYKGQRWICHNCRVIHKKGIEHGYELEKDPTAA